jgi:hypothetical protein
MNSLFQSNCNTQPKASLNPTSPPLANQQATRRTTTKTNPITIPPYNIGMAPAAILATTSRASRRSTVKYDINYSEGPPLRMQRRTRATARDNGVTKSKKTTKAPAPAPTIIGPGHRMYTSCNAIGHIKTNRICPNYMPRP